MGGGAGQARGEEETRRERKRRKRKSALTTVDKYRALSSSLRQGAHPPNCEHQARLLDNLCDVTDRQDHGPETSRSSGTCSSGDLKPWACQPGVLPEPAHVRTGVGLICTGNLLQKVIIVGCGECRPSVSSQGWLWTSLGTKKGRWVKRHCVCGWRLVQELTRSSLEAPQRCLYWVPLRILASKGMVPCPICHLTARKGGEIRVKRLKLEDPLPIRKHTQCVQPPLSS